jgi:hypothetical protein
MICLGILATAASAFSDQTLTRLKSGPEIGSEVSSFYVRAVTGPLAGKSVCYVCRNGDRPVVMIFLRDLNADVSRLLKQLDTTVNRHRADGLRCFVVLLGEASQKDAARLQTLAFDEKLDLPLTLAGESLTGGGLQNLHPDADITAVLYDNRKVTASFAFGPGECDAAACKTVVNAAIALAETSSK